MDDSFKMSNERGQAASHHKRQPLNVLRHLPSITAASHHLRQPLMGRGKKMNIILSERARGSVVIVIFVTWNCLEFLRCIDHKDTKQIML